MSQEKAVEKPNEKKESSSHGGMFRITEWAKGRVDSKRKRRGLGELKPRKKNPIKQILSNSITMMMASVLVAPLERSRILL